MILILGENSDDHILKVISYLNAFPYLSYNDFLPIEKIDIHQDDSLSFLYKSNNINVTWYYRSTLSLNENLIRDRITYAEYEIFLNYILYSNKKEWIGSFYDFFYQNTLKQLSEANKVGLRVPRTIISKKYPENFDLAVNKIIGNVKHFRKGDNIYTNSGTQIIERDSYKDNGHLNFFQEYIPKEFEIRTFYIKEKMFSMAIFSQNDEKTKVDFRNYNGEKPNRNVPFKLPHNIELKLIELMSKLNLNFGSIDLIYSTQGEFVFLEINPGGMFSWLSSNCNYYIEKEIANLLINIDEQA